MKNFKRILSLVMVFILVMGTITVVNADISFSDLPSNHWAYANVQTLVGDGTINGYDDGTFKPSKNVSRAEFVKMIGKTSKTFETPFADINEHWAYDYIMYSDMDVEGTSFRPDEPMTREDVIALLWKRAGSPKAYAPGIITAQSSKPEAAAWGYAYGIMNGDDGITMRYTDGVTRAEAAALICRSRSINASSSKKELTATFDNNALKEVYESNTFLGKYNFERTFTKGELSHLAMQIVYENSQPLFDGLSIDFTVKRPYGISFAAACNYVWGEDKKTDEEYDAPATNLDAVSLLTYAISLKSFNSLVDGSTGDLYADVKPIKNENLNICVSAAYKNGIRLDNTDNIYPDQLLTGENLALILLQLDRLCGIHSSVAISVGASIPVDNHIRVDSNSYPQNKDKFVAVFDEIPNSVYTSDFVDVDGSVCNNDPKDMFLFARDNRDLFKFYLDDLSYRLYNKGVYPTITYYPSLVCESDNGYILKIKVKITDYIDGVAFDDIFPNIISGKKPEIKVGQTYFMTIATGSKFNGLSIDPTTAKFTSIDYIN